MKPRWGRQRFRLYGGDDGAYVNFINALEKAKTDTSHRLAVEFCGTGRAVEHTRCTPAPSKRVDCWRRKRFVTFPID